MSKPNEKTKYYLVGIVIVCAVLIIVVLSQFQPTHFNGSKGQASVENMTKYVVTQLYSTVSGGREWFANWYTPSHTIYSGDFDPYDPQFQARGNGYIMINGDGTAALNGSAPRMYVYDPTLQQKWDNVEITIYAKRVSEQAKVSSQGITAGARSGSHDDVKYPNVCIDSTGYPNTAYNGRLTYDGRADYVKEVLYHRGDAISDNYTALSPKTIVAFPNFTTPLDPSTRLHTMPKNTWIGYKFIVRSIYNDTAVKLETWMDLTDGANGGIWTKMNEYIDKGGWNATYFYKSSSWPCSSVPTDYVITHPMPYVFVRADAVNEIDYKNFSIREINPLP